MIISFLNKFYFYKGKFFFSLISGNHANDRALFVPQGHEDNIYAHVLAVIWILLPELVQVFWVGENPLKV